jgi:two-component system sensor histidine kinase CreC
MRRKLEGKAYVEQYVQSLTHEMKSPLAAIRGAAELLQEPMADADRAHFARSILEQQERLTETIDKLLALAEVEQHGWLQTRAPLALPDLLQQTVAAAQVRAQAAGVEVRTDAVADLSIQGDAYLLRQALNNLVDNAVAFSPSGTEVVLQAQVEDGGVRLQVADRGAGIPDYARDRVFERFYSLARPGSGRRSSGLGLPFVQEVARLHDGRVQLQARDGGGTVASLWLPLGMPGPRTRR